jgi:hypothetical protein
MPGKSCSVLHVDMAALRRTSALYLSPSVTLVCRFQVQRCREVPYITLESRVTDMETDHVATAHSNVL